jgi:hypothetical protein
MASELIIRAGLNDHEVVADLLSPGGAGIDLPDRRSVIGRLVTDATVAVRRPQLADAAEGAGIPFVVDPQTPLLQGELSGEDRWTRLPYGQAEAMSPEDFSTQSAVRDLVRCVVSFQVAQRATTIIPPYPYVSSPDDPWLPHAVRWVHATARIMREENVRLPILTIFAASVSKLGTPATWDIGPGRFAAASADIGAGTIGLYLSPVGDGAESYNKLRKMFDTALHVRKDTGRRVLAWRQGIYGPALVAAGIDGYETGIATGERANAAAGISSRRPKADGSKPSGVALSGIYLEPFGRSVSLRVAQRLLGDVGLRAKLMCSDERCCPHGVTSTIDQRRPHAVRSRARELALLDALPAPEWRLNRVATNADAARILASQANGLLEQIDDEPIRLPTKGYDALIRVADEIRRELRSVAA